jgi:hypothetical protein
MWRSMECGYAWEARRYAFALWIAISIVSTIDLACTNYRIAPHDAGATGGAGGNTGVGGAAEKGAGGAVAATGGTGNGGTTGTGGAAGTGGATGAGGVTGAGGATDGGVDRAVPRALGESCLGNGDCASAHCAGAICCDEACTGPCAQCSSTGHCQMPADDPACGTIACPADTSCRDWATSITSNRCKAVGQCKVAADCGYVNAAAKSYCGLDPVVTGSALVCDAQGNCTSATVTCGPDGECPLGPTVCCVTNGSTCSTTCAQHNLAMFCDDKSDCPPGTVCCYEGTSNGQVTHCQDRLTCVSEPSVTRFQLCNPNTAGECVNGSCQTHGSIPPYFTCQ